MGMVAESQQKQEFSNQILHLFLKITKIEQNQTAFQKLLSELEISKEWLFDTNNWHSAEFHGRFLKALQELMPEEKELSFRAGNHAFSQKKMQLFSSIAGFLLKPAMIWGKMPQAVKRMNLYNTYEFKIVSEKIAYTRAILIQRYKDPSLNYVNSELCEACRGSSIGILDFLGNRLLSMHENKCVKRGDEYCEYEFTWLNRPLLLSYLGVVGLGAIFYLLLSFLNLEQWVRVSISLLAASTIYFSVLNYRFRKRLYEAFEFQQKTLNDLKESVLAREQLNSRLIDFQNKMADTISMASVGELSFYFAHDMGSPMTLASIYTLQLKEELENRYPDEEQLQTYCRAIERATENMGRIQKLFRMMAKGGFSEHIETLDIVRLIKESINLYNPYFTRNKININFDTLLDSVKIRANTGVLESILLNLIQNATNALMKVENRKLSFSLADKEEQFFLTIADSGPGIDKERINRLWERFGPSTTVGGTGYGLYHVRCCVDRLEGTIQVDSSSEGTIFTIAIPKKLLSDEEAVELI